MAQALNLHQAEESLQSLGLTKAAEVLVNHLDAAGQKDMTHLDFLIQLLTTEEQDRYERYLTTRMRLANFPYRKTLADFDFNFQPSVEERQIKELASLAFVKNATNVIFLGPPGVGKTHLAVALGIEAVRQRTNTYFVTLQKLITNLRQAHADNRFERRLRVYTRPALLILDELGYLPLERTDAALLFQLVCERYDRGLPMIITSNVSYGEWDQLIGDTVLAGAMLDRLLHHAVTVNIKGKSYRLKNRLKTGLKPPEGKDSRTLQGGEI